MECLGDGVRFDDLKFIVSINLDGLDAECINLGQGGDFVLQASSKFLYGCLCSIYFDLNAGGCVLDPSIQVKLVGKVIDKRPESNPLNDSLNVDVYTNYFSVDLMYLSAFWLELFLPSARRTSFLTHLSSNSSVERS